MIEIERQGAGSWTTSYINNRRRFSRTDSDLKRRSMFNLDGRFRNWWSVGIVVGAGPSLDKSLPILKKLIRRGEKMRKGQRCAIIYSTDAALKPLLSAGIRPDYVVAMDENICTTGFYDGVDVADCDLLASITTPTEVIDRWLNPRQKRNRVWFYGNGNENVYPVRSEFPTDFSPDKCPELKAVPFVQGLYTNSVTTMALALAQRMWLRHFFLVGCDFDVPGDQTHAGATYDVVKAFPEDDNFPFKWDDYYVKIINAMTGHLQRIHRHRERNKLPIYNCTEGGKLRWNNTMFSYAGERFAFMR